MPAKPTFTQEEIDEALAALIAMAGNATKAVAVLEDAGKHAPHYKTLNKWAEVDHWERYQELRDLYAEKVEAKLVSDMFDVSRAAAEETMALIAETAKRREAGKLQEPSRDAANMAKVTQTMTDKRLTLLGRPTNITETRAPEEILRSLVGLGVVKPPSEIAQASVVGEEGNDAG